MIIKNVRIENTSDDSINDFACHEIEIDEQLAKKILAASDHIWQFNKEWEEEADITLVVSFQACKSPTLQPYKVSVGSSGFYFESDDIAQTERLGFEALKMQRFLLQDGGDGVYQWQDGLDDDVHSPMDFTLIYANSLEEAINQFKSLK